MECDCVKSGKPPWASSGTTSARGAFPLARAATLPRGPVPRPRRGVLQTCCVPRDPSVRGVPMSSTHSGRRCVASVGPLPLLLLLVLPGDVASRTWRPAVFSPRVQKNKIFIPRRSTKETQDAPVCKGLGTGGHRTEIRTARRGRCSSRPRLRVRPRP